jgi:serine/arginine repetitive matrix protein 2
MLGGGHVRRRSVEATPCPRVEKRKRSVFQAPQTYNGFQDYLESPNKARIIEKPSIASTSSYTFGGERMIKARHGLLERQSLEESVLAADGEDLSGSCKHRPFHPVALRLIILLVHFVPVFSRPGPVGRSRSSTITTSSSGGETPPLSSSDGASTMSDGSQSSIDLSQLNAMLSNVTYPVSTTAPRKARARARGHGHRRRISQARAIRSSVYETIEEEMSIGSSPTQSLTPTDSTPTTGQPIFIVDSDAASIDTLSPETSIWDDEQGIVALRKYYALRDEAQDTVTESKQQWLDTPFSVFALQCKSLSSMLEYEY